MYVGNRTRQGRLGEADFSPVRILLIGKVDMSSAELIRGKKVQVHKASVLGGCL